MPEHTPRYLGELRGRHRRTCAGNTRTGLRATIRTPSGTIRATVYPDADGGDRLRAILYTNEPGSRTLYHGPIELGPDTEEQDQ